MVNVPPPATEPVPVLPDKFIVVDTATFEADVARPNESNTITGIFVEPPYVPAVTAVFCRPKSIASAPKPPDVVRILIPFATAAVILNVSVFDTATRDVPLEVIVDYDN